MRLLLIEDHVRLGQSLEEALRRAGYVVDRVMNAEDAQACVTLTRFDLILLDLGLPDGDGLGLLRSWRRGGVVTPVLVLTARGTLNDKVAGLDEGADDYLVKPFALEEMLSRCRALLRRPAALADDVLTCGELSLHTVSGALIWRGRETPLARRERQLLAALMRRPGLVCQREALERALYDQQTAITPNALEVTVSRLRTALRDLNTKERIDTVRGVGYVLREGTRHAS